MRARSQSADELAPGLPVEVRPHETLQRRAPSEDELALRAFSDELPAPGGARLHHLDVVVRPLAHELAARRALRHGRRRRRLVAVVRDAVAERVEAARRRNAALPDELGSLAVQSLVEHVDVR